MVSSQPFPAARITHYQWAGTARLLPGAVTIVRREFSSGCHIDRRRDLLSLPRFR
jgi:hypothetical protein